MARAKKTAANKPAPKATEAVQTVPATEATEATAPVLPGMDGNVPTAEEMSALKAELAELKAEKENALTVEQAEELKAKISQMVSESENFAEVKTNTPQIFKQNPDTYEVPKGEENCIHAEIVQPKFNAHTGEDKSLRQVQKFGKRIWEATKKQYVGLGYKVQVLHELK